MFVGKAVIFRWVVVAVFTSAAIWYAYSLLNKKAEVETLPVYGDNNEDGTQHIVSDFSLINQDGQTITIADFEDKVFVADFFFATCQSICPVMSDQMERIAEKYKNNNNVMLLSHSVKPDEDSVPVLKKYAEEHHADSKKWNFLTGDLNTINQLAISSYMMVDSTTEFVHTQYLALIDTERRIRGYYDGTDSLEVNRLIGDIAVLLREN